MDLDHIHIPRRPMAPVQWAGGKGNMARWIVKHLPRDGVRVYVEPYCGAASVLWHLPEPYPVEVLNDLDQRLVYLFRVLQDKDAFEKLCHRIVWTLYSRAEMERAIGILEDWDQHDDVSRAWAFYVCCNMGHGGLKTNLGSWRRSFIEKRGMADTTNKWRGRMRLLQYWHDRLTRVQIDCRDALEVIRYWDSVETLFYLDPPYVHGTRQSKRLYAHEMTDEAHRDLVDVLLSIQGMAVLSGYPSKIYEPLEKAGWQRVDRVTGCYMSGRQRGSQVRGKGAALQHAKRTECLWLSPRVSVS